MGRPDHPAAIDRSVQGIGFVLLPGFALMSFAAASEPFRAANRLAGRALYHLRYFGEETSGSVAASSGITVPTEPLPREREGLHTVFVCAGGDGEGWDRPAVHAALRRLARLGVRIGGISGGPFLLAAAGLLGERDFTIHWEHAGVLAEAFPDLAPRNARFVLAGDRVTCGGGVASIDMALAIIAERTGPDFVRRVSDWFLHTTAGAPGDPQRASPAERYGIHHPALLAAIGIMEKTIERPLNRRAVAALAGISERHLDRLFREKRGCSFAEQYKALRLDQAQRLLRQSALAVAIIAAATGFADAAHLSRSYRARFGHSPSAERRTLSTPGL